MGVLRFMVLVAIAGAPSCANAQSASVQVTPLFGPVVGRDAIVGRADVDGRVLLLVRDVGLVSIDLDGRTARTTALPPDVMTSCWGLARLSDGSLWTLKDRHSLVQISESGEVQAEAALDAVHFGLVAAGGRLVYQRMGVTPGVPLYESGPPGSTDRVPWTGMVPRTFALSATASLPLNLFTCGESRALERPCWFPDETAVSIIGGHGFARRIELDGLTRVAPEVLVTSDAPSRPIRSAYLASDGSLWILGSGAPPEGARASGAWLLARYTEDGKPLFSKSLPSPARAILRVEEGRALLLASDGMVVEVRP